MPPRKTRDGFKYSGGESFYKAPGARPPKGAFAGTYLYLGRNNVDPATLEESGPRARKR